MNKDILKPGTIYTFCDEKIVDEELKRLKRIDDIWDLFYSESDNINQKLYNLKTKLLDDFYLRNNVISSEVEELREDMECELI